MPDIDCLVTKSCIRLASAYVVVRKCVLNVQARCPMRGAARKLAIVATPTTMSKRTNHWRAPIKDWYRLISSGTSLSERYNSGWSLSVVGDDASYGVPLNMIS